MRIDLFLKTMHSSFLSSLLWNFIAEDSVVTFQERNPAD